MAVTKYSLALTISLLILLISVLLVPPVNQVAAAPAGHSLTPATLNQPYDTTTPTTSTKIVVILAEFPDAKHKVTADEIKRRLIPTLNDYFQEVSYGKASVTIEITKDWILSSKAFSSYGKMLGWLPGSVIKRPEMVNDVLQAAGNHVSFSQCDGVIIILPMVSITAFASTDPISAHGTTINWVTVQTESMGGDVYAHEIGHTVFGMPDLYDYNRTDAGEFSGIYMGAWCMMSFHPAFEHFCAYNKIVANWIPSEQIKTLSPGTSELVTLEPLEIKTSGIQVIKIPTDNKKYYLIESRRKIGFDKSISDEGVLITFIDETEAKKPWKILFGPPGFVKVKDAEPSTEKLSDATFDMRAGKQHVFTDESQNLAIAVFPTQGNAYDVYVTTTSAYKQVSNMVDLGVKAKVKIDEARAAKFGAPEALSLTKEAENKLLSALKSFKSNDHKSAEQIANDTIKLLEKTFTAEQRYTEAKGVLSRADNAIKKAESEGRSKGLDDAKKFLQQAQSTLDTYDYDKAIIAAIKAKKTAEAAAK